ncbi:MAG: RdgB/HAM1 family non-canonical purine NTP pyrophosphatase [Microbacteriaceae bacterium]|nr:RdgB/HAM1 family non-canonical purine NTP pyrophosphatase [Microbacteriaceae bacterium]
MKLQLATGNQHKIQEVKSILGSDAGIDLIGFEGEEPVENGLTFYENALIKARSGFSETGIATIADDSGLAVEVMGGSPGILSARWCGEKDDKKNRELLLAQMVDMDHRLASFVCSIALVTEDGEFGFTGVWSGELARESRGEGGFGYDPIFIPEGLSVTAAELPAEVKNSMSHRFLALSQLADFLRRPQ